MSLAPFTGRHRTQPPGARPILNRLRAHPNVTKITLGMGTKKRSRHPPGTVRVRDVLPHAVKLIIHHEHGFTEVVVHSTAPEVVANELRKDAPSNP